MNHLLLRSRSLSGAGAGAIAGIVRLRLHFGFLNLGGGRNLLVNNVLAGSGKQAGEAAGSAAAVVLGAVGLGTAITAGSGGDGGGGAPVGTVAAVAGQGGLEEDEAAGAETEDDGFPPSDDRGFRLREGSGSSTDSDFAPRKRAALVVLPPRGNKKARTLPLARPESTPGSESSVSGGGGGSGAASNDEDETRGNEEQFQARTPLSPPPLSPQPSTPPRP